MDEKSFLSVLKLEPDDFVVVGANVDITKDGLLKVLNAIPSYSMKTDIVRYDSTVVIVRCEITVKANGEERTGTGHGLCSKEELSNRETHRIGHDTLAIAETRAIKRAIEHALGTAIINSEVRRLIAEGRIQASNWKILTQTKKEIPTEQKKELPTVQQTAQQEKTEPKENEAKNNANDAEVIKKFNEKNASILKEIMNIETLNVDSWSSWREKVFNSLVSKAREWGLEEELLSMKKKYGVDTIRKLRPTQLIEVAKSLIDNRGDYLEDQLADKEVSYEKALEELKEIDRKYI